ncbi:MAG: chromate transporter, partial [Pseudomonadota bacterium]
FFAQLDQGPLNILAPVWSTLDPAAVGLSLVAGTLLLGMRWSLLPVLGLMAMAGLGVSWVW